MAAGNARPAATAFQLAAPSPAATAVGAVLAVAGALWRPRVVRDVEAQAFLDHFPCLRHHTARWSVERFGPGSDEVPALLRAFDWYYYGEPHDSLHDHHGPSWFRHEEPQSVVAAPSRWDAALAAAHRLPGGGRAIAFAGMPERPLSEDLSEDPALREEQVGALQRAFGRVWHEYKDVDVDGIMTLPSGLNEMYLRPGVLRLAWAAIASARLDAKPRAVLAAYTIYWISTAANLSSRVEAREWAASAAGQEAGAELRFIYPREWYAELSTYRFLLSPTGSGIQSAKTIEALLVLTVPIVQRCVAHDDLVALGFPLVVVDRFEEVGAGELRAWWRSLAPRLASFRRNCLTTEAYWRLLVGEIDRCE